MDFNGTFLAQPSRPDHIGKNYLEWKTSDGKYPQKMSIELAKTKGQARRIEETSSGKDSIEKVHVHIPGPWQGNVLRRRDIRIGEDPCEFESSGRAIG